MCEPSQSIGPWVNRGVRRKKNSLKNHGENKHTKIKTKMKIWEKKAFDPDSSPASLRP